jgi:hypothetical protein
VCFYVRVWGWGGSITANDFYTCGQGGRPLECTPVRVYTRLGSSLCHKCLTRVEVTDKQIGCFKTLLITAVKSFTLQAKEPITF